MRKLLLAALLTACGNDIGSAPPDAGGTITLPDGKIVPSGDDASVPTDGSGVLMPCEEATQHSDLTWIQKAIFTPSCASCHGGANPDVGLSLAAGQAYSNLVNHQTSTVSGWTRVIPGNAAQSYLLVAVGRGEGPPPQDGYMPLGEEGPLCKEKIDAIQRWIVAGAPNN